MRESEFYKKICWAKSAELVISIPPLVVSSIALSLFHGNISEGSGNFWSRKKGKACLPVNAWCLQCALVPISVLTWHDNLGWVLVKVVISPQILMLVHLSLPVIQFYPLCHWVCRHTLASKGCMYLHLKI